MVNKNKTEEAAPKKAVKKNSRVGIPVHGVAGILLFIVCISIGYNAFLVLTGTKGLTNQIMAAPSVLFVVVFLAYKAWK